ncbi:5-carboxymethyl-2-hydroxymuconate isomerase [Roseibium sp.]|uniref:5-carboxymethyl-2-hydroxymuconate isomerase n=1 Tax=Roseibium sp. TaxID=1936156 RepID=UPI003BAA9B0D
MPHLSIEYSANLEDRTDIQGLCEHLRAAAAQIEAFPMAGIRVRALKAIHYSIADGSPEHAFADISVRLRGGRPAEVKRRAADHIFEAAKEYLTPVLSTSSLALSLEVRDIDPAISPKTGTIRDHLREA